MNPMPHTAGRLAGIDLARFIALISMFIAHTAPSPGPFGILNLSEFLTAALFAMIIGVSADLSADRMNFPQLFASSVVRAIVLIALGLWSASWGAQVDAVLPYLGLLSLIVALLVYLPIWILGIIGALCWWFTPWAMTAFDTLHISLTQENSLLRYLTLWMVEGSSYRVFTMIAWACVGIILIRLMQNWSVAVDLALALVTTVAAGALWFYISKQFEFFPYTGNRWEVGFDLLLSVAVICWCSLIARIFAGKPGALKPLTVTGRMTLTLYLLQIAALAAYARFTPQQDWQATDDSWIIMGVLILGSILFANLWDKTLGHTFARRGPLETPLAWVSGRG